MCRVNQITKTCLPCLPAWEKKTVNTTIIFVWIHGSGQAVIFDLEDEQTNIRRDESTLSMQTLCFISAGAQRPLAARSDSTCYRHWILNHELSAELLKLSFFFWKWGWVCCRFVISGCGGCLEWGISNNIFIRASGQTCKTTSWSPSCVSPCVVVCQHSHLMRL